MRAPLLAVALTLAAVPSSVDALCVYKGAPYARPALGQEFRDSLWVVRARLLSATDHFDEGDAPWTEYQLEVLESYKGGPPRRLRFFTFRDSGGFYLDRGPAPDLGGEYLLFLNPTPDGPEIPGAARGAVSVNYSCGLSGPWEAVPHDIRAELRRLAD